MSFFSASVTLEMFSLLRLAAILYVLLENCLCDCLRCDFVLCVKSREILSEADIFMMKSL